MSHLIPLPWVKPPITLNPGLRASNPHVKAAKVRDAKAEAGWAIRAAKTPALIGCNITLHYRVPDRRRRDADNLAATLKVCQDALVDVGVLHEDSWITVPSATCRIHAPSADGPALWLELEELS